MTDKIRLGFVGGDHLHFNDLLKYAYACPNAEVVGAVIGDEELRAWFDEEMFSGLARVRGVQCGRRYAEGFHPTRMVLGSPAPRPVPTP